MVFISRFNCNNCSKKWNSFLQYFNNEEYEADQYERVLKKKEVASIKTTTSLAFLNWGQNFITSTGLVGMMLLAVQEIEAGKKSSRIKCHQIVQCTWEISMNWSWLHHQIMKQLDVDVSPSAFVWKLYLTLSHVTFETYCRVKWLLRYQLLSSNGQTDRQTERQRSIWAYCAIVYVSSKMDLTSVQSIKLHLRAIPF